MKRSLTILTVVTVFSILVGCNRRVAPVVTLPLQDSTVTSVTNTYIREDLMGKPDSAIISALLKCDSLGNIYIQTIAQLQGEIVAQSLQLSNNSVTVTASAQHWVTAESQNRDSVSIEIREIPVPYPVEKITNLLTSWQSFQIWIGRIVLISGVIYLLISLLKRRFTIINKLFKQ